MAGSTFGNQFKITTWGESHGKAVGVVIDGCPAGLALTESDIQYYLNLRKPGQSRYTTPRKEEDAVEIMSGIFEGRTTGTPISLIVYNKNARSSDYSDIARYYRPGHADYTFDAKYKDESSRLYIPAHITEEQIAAVRQDAVRVYTALGCRGLSRVDFFVTHDSGEVVFNELNAIPGFTSISMYPKLFDYEGIGYAELLDRLISLALEEHNG